MGRDWRRTARHEPTGKWDVNTTDLADELLSLPEASRRADIPLDRMRRYARKYPAVGALLRPAPGGLRVVRATDLAQLRRLVLGDASRASAYCPPHSQAYHTAGPSARPDRCGAAGGRRDGIAAVADLAAEAARRGRRADRHPNPTRKTTVKTFLSVAAAADEVRVRRETLLRVVRENGDRLPGLIRLGHPNGLDPDLLPQLRRWLVAKGYVKAPATNRNEAGGGATPPPARRPTTHHGQSTANDSTGRGPTRPGHTPRRRPGRGAGG
jgi:hypothetical protein